MAPGRRQPGPDGAAGFSLIEVTIASLVLTVVLMMAFSGIQLESGMLRSMTSISVAETRAQEILNRVEQELSFARGANPTAWLTANLGSASTGGTSTDTTAGFPDQGVVLIGRGTASEECIGYDSLKPGLDGFNSLQRGRQCTTARTHGQGDEVIWAALAEPIAIQTNPAAGLFDGVTMELEGPTFFRGDGTGFSYRMPTDPAGGTNYFVGSELTWGAVVNGQPTLDGWSAMYFAPAFAINEAAAGRDFNLDGDRQDTFDVGQIRKRSWIASNPGQPVTDIGLGPTIVLQEQCNWGGDLDGDGFDDPIFLWIGASRRLHVRMSFISRTNNGVPVVRRAETVVFLRNNPDA